MKSCQLFLFFFILCAPLLGIEEISPFHETELTVDQQIKSPQTPDNAKEIEQKNTPTPEELEALPPRDSEIKKATESYETTFVKTIFILVGLLALVILTVWMFKKISHGRLRSPNSMKSIKVLEKRPLSPKSMLYLIEVNGKQVLIAESQFNVNQMTSLDWIGEDKDL